MKLEVAITFVLVCMCLRKLCFFCLCVYYMFGSLCVFIYLFSVLKGHCEEWGKGECGFFSPYKQRS
jgi:hypothetical protein